MNTQIMADRLQGFIAWYSLYKSPKPSTLEATKRRAARLYTLLNSAPLTLAFCVSFLAQFKSQDYKSSTLKAYVKSMRAVVEYESSLDLCEDFRDKLPKFREIAPAIDILSIDEVKQILQTPGKYQLALELLARTGRRISEVTDLKVKDFDNSKCAILLENPKSNLPKWLPIPPDIAIQLHKIAQDSTNSYFFTMKSKDQPIPEQLIARELKRRAVLVGITKRVYPHLLRHSFATHMLQAGVPLLLVAELLDHHDIKMTQRYTHLLLDDLQQALTAHNLNRQYITRQNIVTVCQKAYNALQGHLPDTVASSFYKTNNSAVIKIHW